MSATVSSFAGRAEKSSQLSGFGNLPSTGLDAFSRSRKWMPYSVGCILLVGIRNGWKNSPRMPNATAPTTSSRSRNARIWKWRYSGAIRWYFGTAVSRNAAASAGRTCAVSAINASSPTRCSAESRSSSAWRRTLTSVRNFASFFASLRFFRNPNMIAIAPG